MRYIKLTQGKRAIVDDEDFVFLSQYGWVFSNTGYAMGNGWDKKLKKSQFFLMHRLITKCPKSKQVDHINHNRLDNRKSNLRICTFFGNAQNRVKRETTSSLFKGVGWDKQMKKWRARINHTFIGLFNSELQAAMAYDIWAKELHGKFAKLNFISGN